MITCQLTKLEIALDQVKKNHPTLVPADAALLASALTLSGRQAIALYEGLQYVWPDDYQKLAEAMVPQIKIAQEAVESTTPKRATKSSPEEEPVMISVGLMPNFSAGERLLEDRDDLKTQLSDVLQAGVEFAYAPSDIYWQWALDRVNWNTIAGQDISRRIRIKATFTEGAVGVEMGTGGPKKRAAKKVVEPEPEPEAEHEAVPDLDLEADLAG